MTAPAVATHPRTSASVLLPELPAEPLVTVVLPAFNAADYVGDAIVSVRQSTYPYWRCVVVDDGSTDETPRTAVTAAGGDPRFVFRRQQNGGHIAALNHAARCVAGDVIALLDNDDVFLPEKLERVISALRARPNAGLVTHRMYVGDQRLAIIGVTPLADRLVDGDLTAQLRVRPTGDPRLGVTSGMVLRREIFDLIFPTDPRIERFPDELIRRIAPLAAEVTMCDEPLGIRRTHDRNQSNDADGGLADYVHRSLVSYRLIRACQERAASELGIELPAADLDLDLMEATLAGLEGRTDALGLREAVMGSPQFHALPAARRIYWRMALALPRPLLVVLARQLYGVSNAKLLLNWHWMRRLRRAGVIPGRAPRPELPVRDVARNALSFGRGARRQPGSRHMPGDHDAPPVARA